MQPANHYWTVLDSNPGTKVYSTLVNAYVDIDDATFLAWLENNPVNPELLKTVTGAADNGSGEIRLTVSSTASLTTGQSLAVRGIVGTTEANDVWQITVIDGTHIDLDGSTFSNVYLSGGQLFGATIIATDAALRAFINNYAIAAYIPRFTDFGEVLTTTDIVLSNPMPRWFKVTNSSGASLVEVHLPPMHTVNSVPLGQAFFIECGIADGPIRICDSAGTPLSDGAGNLVDLNPGEIAVLTSGSNETAIGNTRAQIVNGASAYMAASTLVGRTSASAGRSQAIALAATLALVGQTLGIKTDVALPGNPTAATQSTTNNTTRVATTAFVQNRMGYGQIPFPATQNPSSDANTLDDYEEGTFTPAITFGGASVDMTYNHRYGQYTKIGNCVTFIYYVYLSNKGSSTGSSLLTGLPFSSYGGGAPATVAGFVNLSSFPGPFCATIQAGVNYITPNYFAGGNVGAADDSHYGNTTVISCSGVYYVS